MLHHLHNLPVQQRFTGNIERCQQHILMKIVNDALIPVKRHITQRHRF